jgi:hypothetical protein
MPSGFECDAHDPDAVEGVDRVPFIIWPLAPQSGGPTPPICDEGVVQSGNYFRTEHRFKRCQIIDGIPRTVRADRMEEVPEMIEARVDPFVTRRLERPELARVGSESISEFTPRLFAFGQFHCAAPFISTHFALERELPLGSRSGPRPGLYGLGDLWSGSADRRKACQLIRARAALTPQRFTACHSGCWRTLSVARP